MFPSSSRSGGSDHYGCMRAPIDFCAQSGGGIDASMTSVCLENLETLKKKGVDMEVVYNTVGIVYVGTSRFPIACPPSNCLPQECRTQYVPWSLPSAIILTSPLDQRCTSKLFPRNGSEHRRHENGPTSTRQCSGRRQAARPF